MSKQILIIALVVVVALISFYGGTKYQGSRTPDLEAMIQARFNQSSQQTGDLASGMRMVRFGAGAGFTLGKIISRDEQSITIEVMDAQNQDTASGSKIIFFSESTDVTKTGEGTAEDLSVDTTVMVTGTVNEDGSITAETIQIRPQMPRIGERPAD